MEPHAELLSRLVSVPSVNPMGRNVSGPIYYEAQMGRFLEEWLAPLDLEVRRQVVAPGRDNVIATYHSPNARRHVLLEVHQDTVPVEGMIVDPFAAKIEGGKLFGRGACDDKGPMASMLLALRRMATEKPAGAASVTLALTVDEEHGFTGVTELVRAGIDADCAIVAEPTNLDVVIAHKGVVRWDITTAGRACHSSTPEQGINAIYRMAKVLASIERFSAELVGRPKDPLLGGPTISVGRIEGGISVNVVPDACRIEIDRRLIPGEHPEQVHAELAHHLSNDRSIDFDVACNPCWLCSLPMGNNRNAELVEQFSRSLAKSRSQFQTMTVAYGTDAAAISAAGVPSIVFGPGDIAKAHTKDEFIPLDEVAQAAEIYFDFCANAR